MAAERPRKAQVIFPLVLDGDGEQDRANIQAIAEAVRHPSRSEVLRRLIELASEASTAARKSPEQKWLLEQVINRLQMPWEKQ